MSRVNICVSGKESKIIEEFPDNFKRKKEKERKKISSPIGQYNKDIKHTIGLSEYDGIRKMININY